MTWVTQTSAAWVDQLIPPNLDKLAKSGILFSNYRAYPKCSPTRDAIMTGMDAPPVRTVKDGITLAEALKPAGYGTYFVGKAHGSVIILGQSSTGHKSFEASEAISRGEPIPADKKIEPKKRKK